MHRGEPPSGARGRRPAGPCRGECSDHAANRVRSAERHSRRGAEPQAADAGNPLRRSPTRARPAHTQTATQTRKSQRPASGLDP